MTPGCSTAVLGVALSTILWAVPAGAVVVQEDPLNGDSIDLGGTARTFDYLMYGGSLHAPELPSGSNPAGLSVNDFRARLEIKRGDWLTLSLHDKLTATTSSIPLQAALGPAALGQGRNPATWLPLDGNWIDSPTLTLHHRLDRAFLRLKIGPLNLTVGRQPTTFGRGAIWTPEDIISPFSPLQIDTEFKPGVDALRVDTRLGEHVGLTFLAVGGNAENESSPVIRKDGSAVIQRIEFTFETTRVGIMSGYVRGDAFGAVDVFLDLHGADLHGEITAMGIPDAERRPMGRRSIGRAVLGTTFSLSSNFKGTVEGYWNGSGSLHTSDYVALLASPRVQSGETYNVGQYYAGASMDWTAHALLHVNAATMVNLVDGSALLAPSLRFSVANNTLLILGAFVPIGRSPTFDAAGMTAHSEFGLYPHLYHLDLKTYF